MTAKTILALAQAHRKEPSRVNYSALADAVRELVATRDAQALEIKRLRDALGRISRSEASYALADFARAALKESK
jgi:hypothetical protein